VLVLVLLPADIKRGSGLVLLMALAEWYGGVDACTMARRFRLPTLVSDPAFAGADCVACAGVPAAGVPLPCLPLSSEEKQLPILAVDRKYVFSKSLLRKL
jgi:hypothetical protein